MSQSSKKPFVYLLKNLQQHYLYEYGIYNGMETHYFIGVTTGANQRQAKKNADRCGEKVLTLDVISYSDFIHLCKLSKSEQEREINRITHNIEDAKAFSDRLDPEWIDWINTQVRMTYQTA